jgi:hypothetical protein
MNWLLSSLGAQRAKFIQFVIDATQNDPSVATLCFAAQAARERLSGLPQYFCGAFDHPIWR